MPKRRGLRVRRPKPSVEFPKGITPPKKAVTGVRMVNGKPQYTFSYYSTGIRKSAIKSNGDDADLEIALAICPLVSDLGEDVIDFDTYIEEQQGVLAREREIIAAMEAIEGQSLEWMRLFTELEENKAMKNIPSRDWRPFEQRYRLPQYRTPAAVGAPAIEANLPY